MMKTFTTTQVWKMTKKAYQTSHGVAAGTTQRPRFIVNPTVLAHGCSRLAQAIASSSPLTGHIVQVPDLEPPTMVSTRYFSEAADLLLAMILCAMVA
jgi:hypothetical protein